MEGVRNAKATSSEKTAVRIAMHIAGNYGRASSSWLECLAHTSMSWFVFGFIFFIHLVIFSDVLLFCNIADSWLQFGFKSVILTSLVYEKQQKLRIMMKMHGLGDDPYWMITYAYFLVIYLAYMLCFVLFGSVIGLKFFTLNDYSIQFMFYFIYINLQISLAFLVASIFANVKTAAIVGYIMVFGSELLGGFLFQFFVEDTSFPSIQVSLDCFEVLMYKNKNAASCFLSGIILILLHSQDHELG
ncbi:ABC transporter A family member 6 [Camellia lanceoleosa]|uniref:ABC transporter A family member 6 n=1 Tax=Camellia lanceoleosa TaxID=1840588 RepID=A0ACC0J2F3_9ERIC|nr:ABC transporter A family member 6 [Camellia lanceoleosa]